MTTVLLCTILATGDMIQGTSPYDRVAVRCLLESTSRLARALPAQERDGFLYEIIMLHALNGDGALSMDMVSELTTAESKQRAVAGIARVHASRGEHRALRSALGELAELDVDSGASAFSILMMFAREIGQPLAWELFTEHCSGLADPFKAKFHLRVAAASEGPAARDHLREGLRLLARAEDRADVYLVAAYLHVGQLEKAVALREAVGPWLDSDFWRGATQLAMQGRKDDAFRVVAALRDDDVDFGSLLNMLDLLAQQGLLNERDTETYREVLGSPCNEDAFYEALVEQLLLQGRVARAAELAKQLRDDCAILRAQMAILQTAGDGPEQPIDYGRLLERAKRLGRQCGPGCYMEVLSIAVNMPNRDKNSVRAECAEFLTLLQAADRPLGSIEGCFFVREPVLELARAAAKLDCVEIGRSAIRHCERWVEESDYFFALGERQAHLATLASAWALLGAEDEVKSLYARQESSDLAQRLGVARGYAEIALCESRLDQVVEFLDAIAAEGEQLEMRMSLVRLYLHLHDRSVGRVLARCVSMAQ